MSKYYRVKKENFLWEVGAILQKNNNGHRSGYSPIEDLWDKTEHNEGEYISAPIIENNPEFFERVYPDELNKLVFRTAQEMKQLFMKFVS